jgi:hypothetical protein
MSRGNWDHLRGGGNPEDDDGLRDDPRRLANLIIQRRRARDREVSGDGVDPVVTDNGDDTVARQTISTNWRDE